MAEIKVKRFDGKPYFNFRITFRLAVLSNGNCLCVSEHSVQVASIINVW